MSKTSGCAFATALTLSALGVSQFPLPALFLRYIFHSLLVQGMIIAVVGSA
jgi:hypothetical protein